MRDSLRVLRISGALVLVVAFAPAMAQSGSAPQESSTSATPPATADANGQAAKKDAPTDTRRRVIGINGSELPSGSVPETAPHSNAAADTDSSKDSTATKDQDTNATKGQDSNAPQFDHGAPAARAPSAAIPSADMKKAVSILRRSTRDYAACTQVKTCSAYFDSFGVAFNFADGSIAAYSHDQRGKISGHDCVINARNAMIRGDRSLAVQWMMAAQADILNRNWIADHPDAMLEALRTFRGWA